MSLSDNAFDLFEIPNPENIVSVERIEKPYSAIQFSESTGLVAIDLSKDSAAGKAFSNIHIIRMNSNRFLVLADAGKIYSAAQIKDYVSKSRNKAAPLQILNYYGIDEKDYFFHPVSGSSEPLLVFRSQKLVSKHKKKIKIDCPNYVIISES